MFPIFIEFKLVEASQLQVFDGYCRDGSDDKDSIRTLEATDYQDCYKQCKITDGCTAFAYDDNDPNEDCALYRGGPYTYGNGKENTRCYNMPTGNLTYIYSYYYNIINFI